MLQRQPSNVSLFYHVDEIKEQAEKILLEETGLDVNVIVSLEDDNGVYLELHHNEDYVIEKLEELEFDVDAPIEDTVYLLEKISGHKNISFEGDIENQQVEIRVLYTDYMREQAKSAIIGNSLEANGVFVQFDIKELEERAAKIMEDKTGLKVKPEVDTDDAPDVYFSFFMDNEEDVEKLEDLGFEVSNPGEITPYLMEEIVGVDNAFSYYYLGNGKVTVLIEQ